MLANCAAFGYVTLAVMRFEKYQGLGNDFVIIEVESDANFDSELAKKICDRHFGVGADGVLLLSPSPDARARMVVVNADGSVPEMCGNGLRCVALHLARRASETRADFEVDTGAGSLRCELRGGPGEAWVKIGLGKGARLPSLQFDAPSRQRLDFARVSMGNPHAITFGHALDIAEIDEVAPLVSAQIPGGANVEFVRQTVAGELEVVVWERGVGRTLACGTGAAATVVAAIDAGLAEFGKAIRVLLPGGALVITVSADLDVSLAGPARHVFTGELTAFG